MDSDTATESNLSLKSRSLLHRVTARVRKILDHSSKDAMQDIDKHSFIWKMFYVFDIGSIYFHWKNYSENFHSIKNTGNNLTMKQMFNISEKLTVGKSDEIYEVTPTNWEDSSWKQLSLVIDEEVISLSHAKVSVFSDSVLCFGKMHQNPTFKYCLGRKVELVQRFTTVQNFGHNWRRANGIGVVYFPRLRHNAAQQQKSKSSCLQWAINQKNLKDGSSSSRCPTTSYGDLKTMNGNVLLTPHLCLYLQKDFHQDVDHSSDLDQKRSGILLVIADHEENGTESLNWWWSNSEKADTQFSGPRVHCPEKRSKAKEVENYQDTSVPMGYDWNCFSHKHFSESAQYLRSSLRFVWWTQCLSSKNDDNRGLLKSQKSSCWLNQPKTQNQTKMRVTIKNGETRAIPKYRNGCKREREREPCGWQSSWTQRLTRKFFSWIIFRAYTCEKCGFR